MPDWSADIPLDDPGKDRFSRRSFAARLAEAIVSRSDPTSIVIGLYASWGAGKSTLLKFVERNLAEHPNLITLTFNPWFFSEPTALIRAFFDHLATAIEAKLLKPAEELGGWLRTYGPLLASVTIKIPGLEITPAKGFAEVGKELEKVSLEELRNRITEKLAEGSSRIVVFLDDVDRLDRDEMHLLLKLVKLIAPFPNVVYVLAMDEELVAESVGQRYGRGDGRAGREFLEKIVQVPLHLPLPESTALQMYCLERVQQVLEAAGIDITQEQANEYQSRFLDGLAPAITTPRAAIRYANALSFALPLLKREVNLVDFLLLEGMRLLYPRLYEFVRSRPDIVLGQGLLEALSREHREAVEKTYATGIEEEGLGTLVGLRREAARKLIVALFPRLGAVLGLKGVSVPGEEELARQKRVASEAYFSRYFAYAVPESQVSDVALEGLLAAADGESLERVEDQLRELLSRPRADALVGALRRQAETVPPRAARQLALAMAKMGDRLPRPQVVFSFATPFIQGAILIKTLLGRLPQGAARLETAIEVIRTAVPLPFAAACTWWIRRGEDAPDDRRVLAEDDQRKLEAALAVRIREQAQAGPLYIQEPRDAPELLTAWAEWGSRDEVAQHLRESFAAERENVLRFLESCAPIAWSSDRPGPYKTDLTRSHYEAIANLIPPDEVYERLRAVYGPALDTAGYHRPKGAPLQERLAHQFAALHHAAREEARKAAEAPEELAHEIVDDEPEKASDEGG